MIYGAAPPVVVIPIDHVAAIPSKHDDPEHLGSVSTPATAGRCELKGPSVVDNRVFGDQSPQNQQL